MAWKPKNTEQHLKNLETIRTNERFERYRHEAHEDLGFALWLVWLDVALREACGLTHHDLSDFSMRDLYDDGVAPKEAAQQALANDDTFAHLN